MSPNSFLNMKRTVTITNDRFEALEAMMIAAGIVSHGEEFITKGARFLARGFTSWIEPLSFNGAHWKVAVHQSPEVN